MWSQPETTSASYKAFSPLLWCVTVHCVRRSSNTLHAWDSAANKTLDSELTTINGSLTADSTSVYLDQFYRHWRQVCHWPRVPRRCRSRQFRASNRFFLQNIVVVMMGSALPLNPCLWQNSEATDSFLKMQLKDDTSSASVQFHKSIVCRRVNQKFGKSKRIRNQPYRDISISQRKQEITIWIDPISHSKCTHLFIEKLRLEMAQEVCNFAPRKITQLDSLCSCHVTTARYEHAIRQQARNPARD